MRKMTGWKLRYVSLAVVGLWNLLPATMAWSESYVAGMVGYTVPQDVTRTELTDTGLTNPALPGGTTSSNAKLNNALMYGAKFGHYFDSLPWLGLELESFVTRPNSREQQLTLSVPGIGQLPVQETGSKNRLIVVAANVVARYQMGAFEPYVGVGPGVFFLRQTQAPLTAGQAEYAQSSTRPGLNAEAGLRYRVTDHVSVFGEYKYNYFHFHLSGQADGSYAGTAGLAQLHHFIFGVGYHF